MKLSPQKRTETCSATVAHTLWIVSACSALLLMTAYASDPNSWNDPSWWNSSGAVLSPQVVTNADGVVTTNYITNNNAVVVQGQLKQFTARAVDELNAKLTIGAGPALTNLVYGWHEDYVTHNYNNSTNAFAPYKPNDFTTINLGQVKTIANLVYGRLSAAGYANLSPSWLPQNTNSDSTLAVIGQLKRAFDFDFSLSNATNLEATSGPSGAVDLNWSLPANTNNIGSWVVEVQNTDGSWSILTTLGGTATSYSATNLAPGEGDVFQVFASGTNVVSPVTSVTGPQTVAPTASPSAGAYPSAQTVTVSSTTVGATIYYTTDGSTPTTNSASVASGGTVLVSSNEFLKINAVAPGYAPSTTATQVYVIGGELAAGWNHSVLLKTDGTVWTWGSDTNGQLGDNQAGNGVPQQITAFTNAIAVGAGDSHTIAVDGNGNVWAWGYNADGEVGDGTQVQRNVPVQVESGSITSPVIAVAGGSHHSLALDSTGAVWAWGDNSLGQLGTGDHTAHLSPVKVTGLSNVVVVAIATHGWHNLALGADGSVWAWGDNTYGQIGNGTTATNGQTTPVEIMSAGSASEIACGTEHSVAIMTNGSVESWGANYNGQLGLGNTMQETTPQIIPNLSGITSLTSDSDYTVALEANNVIAWGNNNTAQLGQACYQVQSSPVTTGDANEYSLLAAGGQHVVALQPNGAVWGWGNITGTGPSLSSALFPGAPANVILSGPATGVTARAMSSRALLTSQSAVAWGQNFDGSLGDGTTNERNTPTSLTSLNSLAAIPGSVISGLAVDVNGNAYTWGLNAYGQLGGNQTIGLLNPTPTQTGDVTNAVAGASGYKNSLLLDSSGHVWGAGDPAALGLSGISNVTAFQQLSGLSSIQTVCLGQGFGLALRSDGTVWTMSSGTTTQVTGLPSISSIWAAGQHAFAIDGSGDLWAWGDNSAGQLGNGTTTAATTPIEIAASSFSNQTVRKITGDAYSTMALTANGQVWAWGDNTYYQLGDGTTSQHLVPHLTSLTGKAIDIAMGYYHALALKEDGTVASWGINLDGELGLGVSQIDGAPRQVMGVGAIGTAPTITAPSAPPSSVPMGTTITLQPTAAASTGHNIVGIIYYSEGTVIGESLTAPFSLAWTPPTWGTFHFNFVAVDDQGLESTPLSASYAVSVPYDSDGNGLPDWWEIQYFGQTGNNPSSDPDGNGLTLLQDYQQGNDPTNYYSQGGAIITPTVAVYSGNNQTGTPGAFLANPLVVKVTNSSGAALVNAPVTFSVSPSIGAVAGSASSTSSVSTYTTTTDSNGLAQAYFEPGLIANFTFGVTATTGTGQVTFTETTPVDNNPPAAPGNCLAGCGCYTGDIELTWVNNADNATYLTIQQSTDNVSWTTIATISNPNATSYNVMGLTVGQPYYFRISAGN